MTVASDGSVQANQQTGEADMEHLGKAVAAAVQKELHNQKRSGGILSPVGAA